MATLRQKKLAKSIVENMQAKVPLNKQELVVSVGYAPITADVKAGEIIDSKGVQEELKALGFTEENAMNVVTEIMLNSDVEPNARLKATDQVFKVRGTYAPVKNVNVNLNTDNESKDRAKQIIRGYLNDT